LSSDRGIGSRLAIQVNADEGTNRLTVIDGIFYPFVRQPEALLCNVPPQHSLHANRRPAAALAFGIERLDLRHQRRPRRHPINLRSRRVTFFFAVYLRSESCVA
jgi:hypothetical protein